MTNQIKTKGKDPLIHFPFYINQYQGLLSKYSFKEKGAFISLLCAFLSEDGILPENNNQIFRICGAFEEEEKNAILLIKEEVLRIGKEILKTQREKRKKCRESAKLGGLTKVANAKQTLKRKGKRFPSNTETETETDKEIEKDNKKESIKKKFIAPTLQEVKDYCQERNNSVDAKKFFDYYDTGNWKDAKGNQVKNWKQKLLTWEGKLDNGHINQNNGGKLKHTVDFINNLIEDTLIIKIELTDQNKAKLFLSGKDGYDKLTSLQEKTKQGIKDYLAKELNTNGIEFNY